MKLLFTIFLLFIISLSSKAQIGTATIGSAKLANPVLAGDDGYGNSSLAKCSARNFSCGESPRVTYTFNGDGLWNIGSNWQDNTIPPEVLPDDAQIIIDPVTNGSCILNVQQIISPGAGFYILEGRSFRVGNNLIIKD